MIQNYSVINTIALANELTKCKQRHNSDAEGVSQYRAIQHVTVDAVLTCFCYDGLDVGNEGMLRRQICL